MSELSQKLDDSQAQQEVYSHGYNSSTIQRQETRTVEQDAAFLLPYLRSGMSLLDCGCGSGSITVGLASIVTPGQVIGIDIDIEESVIEQATSRAIEDGISNVTFKVASVYELPFPDQSFEGVFAHTLLEHLREPMRALAEMKRVLKLGGIVGLRDMDARGILYAPEDSPMTKVNSLVEQQMKYNGGNPHLGSRLGSVLRKAGFVGNEISATFSQEDPENLAEIFTHRILNPPLGMRIK